MPKRFPSVVKSSAVLLISCVMMLTALQSNNAHSQEVVPAHSFVMKPSEMPASRLKDHLVAELKSPATAADRNRFFLTLHPISEILIPCLFMAAKQHDVARKLLTGEISMNPQLMQILRDNEETAAVVKNLELLEGQPFASVAVDIAMMVNDFDVISEQEKIYTEVRAAAKTLRHIAIVPDGDRRWAEERGLSKWDGQKLAAFDLIPQMLNELFELQIPIVTLWCFSTGNWNRSPQELDNLMNNLFPGMVDRILPFAKRFNFRIKHLGRKSKISKILLDTLDRAEAETAMFTKFTVNIGIDYSGRDEICRAVNTIVKNGITADLITEDMISKALDTGDLAHPNPDMIVRYGEQRLSGFMSWQNEYSELYFTKKYYPDYKSEDMHKAILYYAHQKRNFGK